MLAKRNIKIVAVPPSKIYKYLPSVKDALGLRTPDVNSIPCECGKVGLFKSESNNTIDIHV
jgi:hypothetical protein